MSLFFYLPSSTILNEWYDKYSFKIPLYFLAKNVLLQYRNHSIKPFKNFLKALPSFIVQRYHLSFKCTKAF